MSLVRHLLAPLALAALLAACGGDFYYAGAANDCTTLPARLKQLGFDPNDVVSVDTQSEHGQEGAVLRRWAVVQLKSCDGYVVVRTDGGCGLSADDAHTIGNCRITEGRGA